jgi:hypothetical protein
VLSWGGPLDIVSLSAGQAAGTYRSFVAGFRPGYVTSRFEEGGHLTREVVRYAGESPMALVAARRPTAYTALDAAQEPTT